MSLATVTIPFLIIVCCFATIVVMLMKHTHDLQEELDLLRKTQMVQVKGVYDILESHSKFLDNNLDQISKIILGLSEVRDKLAKCEEASDSVGRLDIPGRFAQMEEKLEELALALNGADTDGDDMPFEPVEDISGDFDTDVLMRRRS